MLDALLAQVIDRNPLVVSPDAFVVEAMECMNQTDSSVVFAIAARETEPPRLLGLLTAKDVVGLVAVGTSLKGLRVREVMSENPVTLKASACEDLGTVIACLRQHRLSQIPIVDDDCQLLGVLTLSSLWELFEQTERKLQQAQQQIAVQQRTNSLLQQNVMRRQQANLKIRQLDAKLNRRIVEKISRQGMANQVLMEKLAECSLLEQKIRSSEEEMRSLLAGIRDLILVVDREFHNLQILPTHFMLGSEAAAGILDKTIAQFWDAETDDFRAVVRQVLDSQQTAIFGYPLTVEGADLELAAEQPCPTFWFSASISPLSADTVLWVARDISQRQQAEQSLHNLNRVLEQRVQERTAELETANAQLQAEIRERQQREVELQESEAKFRALLQTTPSAIFFYQGTKLRYVNLAATKISGYSQAELLEMNFWDVIHPDWQDVARERGMARQRGEAIPPRYELKILTKGGEVRWVDFCAGQMEFEGQTAVLGTAIDITDRKLAEWELRESEERFRELAERIRDVFFIQSADANHYFYVSPAYKEIWERTCDSLYENPQSWLEAVHLEDRDRLANAIDQQQLQGEPLEAEYRLVRSDGSIRWIFGRTFPIFDAAGQLLRHVGLAEDITQRKITEIALQKSEERFRAIFEQAAIGIKMCTKEAAFITANQQFCNLVGYTESELQSLTFIELTYPDDRQASLNALALLEDGRVSTINLEKRYLHKQGHTIWANTNISLLRDPDSNSLYYLAATQDISERKASEKRLRSQQAAIVELSQDRDLYAGHLNGVLQKITEVAARTLAVERASIWFYRDRHTSIEQIDLYELRSARHSCGQVFSVEDHPRYFQALETQDFIAADDVRQDPRTREFLDDLLLPVGIVSMLDVPIRSGGITIGIICYEQVGSARHWTVEEQNFASYLANVVSLGLESRDRLRVEEALKESEARYRSIVDMQTDLICRYLTDGTITFVNHAICRYVGLMAEDLIGLKLNHFVVAEDRELVARHLNSLTPESPIGTIECRNRLPSGEIRWQQWKSRAIYDTRGNLVEFQGIGRDITQRKYAEVKLRATQERFQYLLASNPAIVYTCHLDEGYPVTFISPNVQEILGYSFRNFLAEPHFWVEHIHPEDQPTFLKQRSSLTQEQHCTCEYRFLHREGTYRWLRDEAKLLRDAAGNPLEAIGSLIDISDRKRAEVEVLKTLEKERELVALKSRFISTASHEFRTPLTVIKSSAQLLGRYEWSREEQHPYLQQIQSSVQHMTALLNDVLVLSQAEAGKLEFNPVSTDLVKFCRRLADAMQIGADNRTIQFSIIGEDLTARVCSEGDEVRAEVDEKLLRQILSNLLSNAIKYSPADKPILLTLHDRPQSIAFHVQDFGIGIPRPDQHRIFESFHRAQNIGTIQGTGLGLSIVKGFVERHGGTIDFCSQLGEGTTFSVTLPRFRRSGGAAGE